MGAVVSEKPAVRPCKPAVLVMDTRDDRRELHRLICRLSPRGRMRFLEWCCQHAQLPTGPRSPLRPRPRREMYERAELAYRDSSADERHGFEVWLDVNNLAVGWDLDLKKAGLELVERVRQQERHLPQAPVSPHPRQS